MTDSDPSSPQAPATSQEPPKPQEPATAEVAEADATEPEATEIPPPANYDVAIVGGGLAGVMTALRLSRLDLGLSIGLWEDEPHLGGRSISGESGRYSYGQTLVTEEFLEFFISGCAPAGSPPKARPCPELAVLSQSTLKPIALSELNDDKGVKIIGGNVAVKEWQEWQALDKSASAGKALSKALSLPRKGAFATVLNILAPLIGLTEVWEADSEGLSDRLARLADNLQQVDWDLAWPDVLRHLHNQGVAVHLGCPILSCDYDKAEGWQLSSKEQPAIKAKKLVVAVNPWDALNFIGKKLLPTPINQLVSRGKPVSLVTLTVMPDGLPNDFPQLSLIPAEKTVATLQPSGQLTFQVAIDFEKYLDAPSVVKAVKKLRRSHKKLLAQFPDLELSKEHIALVPVGYSCSLGYKDRKLFTKLAEGAFEKDHLYFVGDAYGQSATSEQNIRQSVLRACHKLAPEAQPHES